MTFPRAPLSILLAGLLALPAFARLDVQICGSYRDRWKEELFLHQQSVARREQLRRQNPTAFAVPSRPARADIGGFAILEDVEGVVARRNDFNLDGKRIRFEPQNGDASTYTFTTDTADFDSGAAADGALVTGIGDDDFRQLNLPFSFPFFGKNYDRVFLNSDGNLTFEEGDGSSSERTLGRLVAGPPRIAALFRDLDPTLARDGIHVLSQPDRFVVSWVRVPEYSDFGFGNLQTFQLRIYPNGRIDVVYAGSQTDQAVVGIAPGYLRGSTTVLSFVEGSSSEFSAAVAERFGSDEEVDVVTAAQKFYQNHEDA